MKVVFHASAGPDLAGRLFRLPGLDVSVCREDDTDALFRLLPNCDVLWHVLQRCTAEMIAAAPGLKLIQKIGVGVNTIDLEAAKQRGIPVCNLPGTNARAVAELALGLMLSVLRRIASFDRGLRAGTWTDVAMQDGLGELGGRTVGLVGFGAIPRILAPILAAMGCRVIYTARTRVDDPVAAYRTLDQLLVEADVVSLHLPLVPETEHVIDAEALGRMKPGAILINTGRGGLVDPAALVAALSSGRIAGAGLDVFETEPLPAGDPVLLLPNVVVTPHVGWLTTGTFDRSFLLAAENCRRVASGDPLLNRVI
ncbi:D-isomer specific 2-hydroxyacid dehydrogenase family protein [Acidisphaera sp. S103]|uniref:NAD(P)-dependent oxidoreductase n=1 Tax=Acidisphaera sp. S103 TaxID=1747223 RepID=UPI00131D291F|nr:2-hydroxyacid dehydrogenase [Acidisphaera sp. S103]